jgi:hypothetical protein
MLEVALKESLYLSRCTVRLSVLMKLIFLVCVMQAYLRAGIWWFEVWSQSMLGMDGEYEAYQVYERM